MVTGSVAGECSSWLVTLCQLAAHRTSHKVSAVNSTWPLDWNNSPKRGSFCNLFFGCWACFCSWDSSSASRCLRGRSDEL